MPELPEVETVKNAIADAALGGIVTSVWTSGQKMRWPMPENISTVLTKAEIIGLKRRGKYIIMDLAKGNQAQYAMIIHLGMSGSVRIYPKALTEQEKKHDHLVAVVEQNGQAQSLVLNDPRRFGGVQITPYGEDENHTLLKNMGVEPLGNALSAAYMAEAFAGKTAPIKSALLDQRVIAGIGNIYASEALYLAKISPKRLAKNVSMAKLEVLNETIRAVLTKAIEAGGTSLRDHIQPGGEIGYFAQQLNVYGREGEDCPECGKPIKMIRQTGRASFYCSSCQR